MTIEEYYKIPRVLQVELCYYIIYSLISYPSNPFWGSPTPSVEKPVYALLTGQTLPIFN